MLQRVHGTGNRQKSAQHVRALHRRPHGIFGDVRLHAAEFQIITRVEHAAIGVPARRGEGRDVLFRRRAEHHRAADLFRKLPGEHGLGNFGAEVAQIHAEGVAAGFLNVRERLPHMDFALHDADGAFVDVFFAVLAFIRRDKRIAPIHRQRFGKAVPRYRHDSHFDCRDVVHFLY